MAGLDLMHEGLCPNCGNVLVRIQANHPRCTSCGGTATKIVPVTGFAASMGFGCNGCEYCQLPKED